MLIPLLYGWKAGDDVLPFLYSVAVSGISGAILVIFAKSKKSELQQREGILLVTLVWLVIILFGCLPFYFSSFYPGFTDAFFEAASGFTTTGASVLEDVESLPISLRFWRCFSSWIGGMGVLLLGIAILPLVGIGGMPLYRAEFPGARSEKLPLRMRETAQSLWKIYCVITLLQILALRLAGMDLFDAVCHSFSTISTGGFSTRNNGVAAFDSFAVECILIVFMMVAGINFTLHYRFWVRRQFRRFFSDPEIRFYFLVAASAVFFVTLSLVARDGFAFLKALRRATFQVCSVMTGTGLVAGNYGNWNAFAQLVLLVLMFFGGCTGSTTGGLKSSRILLMMKIVGREFRRMVESRAVFTVRLGTRTLAENTVQSVLNLVYLAFLTYLISCLLLSLAGLDLLTAISAVGACMFNVGPGLGHVGPAFNYGGLPLFAKWVLSFCMLVGRLEFYTVLVLCAPAFWRR